MITRVLDTETVIIPGTNHARLVWQIGWIDADNNGVIIDKHEYLIGDVYYRADKSDRFYKDYDNIITAGEITVANWGTVKRVFNETMQENNVKVLAAYNAIFDMQALEDTTYVLSNGITNKFVDNPVKWRCIMRGAAQTFLHTQRYFDWAIKNNEVTKRGIPSITAQAAYRYLTKNEKFVEAHTALADVEIELQLLLAATRQHKRINWTPQRVNTTRAQDCDKFYWKALKKH